MKNSPASRFQSSFTRENCLKSDPLAQAVADCRRPWWKAAGALVASGMAMALGGTAQAQYTFSGINQLVGYQIPTYSFSDQNNWVQSGSISGTATTTSGTISSGTSAFQILLNDALASGSYKVGSLTVQAGGQAGVSIISGTSNTALDLDNRGNTERAELKVDSAIQLDIQNRVLLTSDLAVNGGTYGGTVVLQGSISAISVGGGSISVSGGTLRLQGANSYAGQTEIRGGGTVQVENTAALGTSGVVLNVGTLELKSPTPGLAQANNVTLAGNGSIIVNGTAVGATSGTVGTVVAGAPNVSLSVTPGTSATGASALNVSSIALSGGGSLTIQVGTSGTSGMTVNVGTVSGGGPLVKSGAGVLNLGAAGTYTGGTQIDQGTLVASANDALGSGTVSLAAGTVLKLDGATVGNTVAVGGTAKITAAGTSGAVGVGTINMTAGSHVLTVDSAASSPITLTAGSLLLQAGAGTSNEINIVNGASGSTRLVVSGTVTGGAELVKNGSGRLELSGPNDYSGGTDIRAGDVVAKDQASLGSGTLKLTAGSLELAFVPGAAAGTVSSGTVSNSSPLRAASGTIVINVINASSVNAGTVDYTIGVQGGTLFFDGNTGGTAKLSVINGGSIASGQGQLKILSDGRLLGSGTSQVDVSGGQTQVTLSGTLSGTNVLLKKSGTGTLVLSGTNTYSGSTEVAGGVLKMGNASALGAATNNFTLSGGTLDLNGNSLIGGTVVSLGLGSGTITDSSPGGGTISATVKFDATVTGGTNRVTIEVPLAGAAYLVKAADGAIELKKKNTYTGGTTVSGGSLILSGGDNTLLPNTAIFVTGGTLDLGGSTQDAANAVVQLTRGVVQNGTLSKNSGSFEALVVSGDTVTLANNARLQGTGAILVKNGDGKLVLAGTNAHEGGTIINAGVVEVGASGAFGTGVVDFQGGLLQGTSPGQVVGNRIALSGEAVFAGNLVFTGTVSGAGALIVDAAGKTVALNAASTFAADVSLNNGELRLGADQSTSGVVQLKQGTVSGSGTLTGSNGIVVNTAAAANKVTVGASLSGNLVKTGDGTLELLSDQRNLGVVTLNQGTVSGSGKTLTASSGITVNTAASSDVVTVTVGTRLSGNLNKTGDGTLVLNGSLVAAASAPGLTVNGGSLTVDGGKVAVGRTGKLGEAGAVTLNNGELNLLSNQTTSGTVTLNKGTVSGSGTLTGSNGIVVNTAAVGDTVTVGANLSGKVSKTGDGTLVLNGSLAGVAAGASDVEINGGKVAVGATGKLGATGAVTLTKGELNLESDQTTGSVTLREGTVSGEGKTLQAAALSVDTAANAKVVVDAKLGGTLTKVGEGTLLLNSSNAALDAVTVSRGTVVAGADNALGTKFITVNANGVLDLGQFEQATTGATIEGTLRNGALEAGSATVTVKTGANVNNVALKAANGTVDLSGGAVTGSVVEAGTVKLGEVDVVGGKLASTSQIAASMAVKRTVGADITSLNGLKKAGVGELILSGNNAGMSGLDVTAGTVTVSGQQALGRGDIRVNSGATLKAPGAVAQPAAKFEVNGEFSAQLLEVGGGKTVSGVGTVNAGVLLSANGAQTGAIAPGNSVGSLTVRYLSGTGDYIWERTAPPIGGPVRTPGSDYDQIVVGGPGQLQGITVRLRNDSGVAIPAVSTDPGGESLAYDQVRVNPRESLVYTDIIKGNPGVDLGSSLPKFDGPNTAVIKIRLVRTSDPAGDGIDLVVDRSSYAQFGRGKSGRAFGAYLDSQLTDHYDQNTAIGSLLRNLDATASAGDVSAYMRAVDPGAAYASLYNVGLRRAHTAAVPLEDRLDLIAAAGAADSALQLAAGVGGGSPKMIAPGHQDEERNWTAWTSGQSSVLRTNAKADFGTIQSSDNVASVGVEHQIGNLRIGGLASFGQGSATFGSPALRVESDHWHVGGYGSVAFGAVTVDASALFGSSDESSTRSVAAGPARGNFGSTDSQVGVGVALNLIPKTSGWQVTPVARLKYVSYKQDAFAESGPGGALLFNTGSINEDTVLSKVGFRVAHSSEVSKSFKLGLDGAAYWVHDFNSEGRNISLGLQGANGAFQATGRNGQANTAQLNLGVQAILAESVTVRLSGQQEVGANRYQSTGVFTVGWNF